MQMAAILYPYGLLEEQRIFNVLARSAATLEALTSPKGLTRRPG
jgi:hypothetical protein